MQAIKAGIGLHTGPLITGITGYEHRLDAATIFGTEGMQKYSDQKFEKAMQIFQTLSEADPEDFAAQYYFNNAVNHLRSERVLEKWSGVLEMGTR